MKLTAQHRRKTSTHYQHQLIACVSHFSNNVAVHVRAKL
jgi:hypothetical protein